MVSSSESVKTKKPRARTDRTRTQWIEILEEYEKASAAKPNLQYRDFCKKQKISERTFRKWRNRLTRPESPSDVRESVRDVVPPGELFKADHYLMIVDEQSKGPEYFYELLRQPDRSVQFIVKDIFREAMSHARLWRPPVILINADMEWSDAFLKQSLMHKETIGIPIISYSFVNGQKPCSWNKARRKPVELPMRFEETTPLMELIFDLIGKQQ